LDNVHFFGYFSAESLKRLAQARGCAASLTKFDSYIPKLISRADGAHRGVFLSLPDTRQKQLSATASVPRPVQDFSIRIKREGLLFVLEKGKSFCIQQR
jgi:hypothetical protein